MNETSFLDNFGYIANASDGVMRLREMICRLGVTGNLSNRLATDSDASDTAKKAAQQKKRLISLKLIRQDKGIEPISDSEFDFNVPAHWEPIRLGNMLNVIRGASPRPKGDPRYFSKQRTDFHWIKISDIRKHSDGWNLKDTDEFLTPEGAGKSVILKRGTFIVTVR